VSSIYIYLEREFESKKWSQLRVNRADKNNRKGLELTSNSSFNFRHLGKECVEMLYFDFDLKTNTMVLWTDHNLISDPLRYVNGRHLGFTFLIGRMTEVLTPVTYGAHWAQKLNFQLGFTLAVSRGGSSLIYKDSFPWGGAWGSLMVKQIFCGSAGLLWALDTTRWSANPTAPSR
jgi:hypothetical protein